MAVAESHADVIKALLDARANVESVDKVRRSLWTARVARSTLLLPWVRVSLVTLLLPWVRVSLVTAGAERAGCADAFKL